MNSNVSNHSKSKTNGLFLHRGYAFLKIFCIAISVYMMPKNVVADQIIDVTATASGVLTCATPSVTLTGSTSTTGAVTYQWSGSGTITNATSAVATVTTPGLYTVTVTEVATGTSASASVVVTQNVVAPNATITNTSGTTALTCYVNALVLTGSSTTSGATFQWSGPSGFNSTNAAITVTTAGVYTLTVTSPNGCTTSVSQVITQSLVSPTATATVSGALTCSTSTVTLSGSATATPVTYSWSGPGGFTSTLQNPTVSTTGTYVLTATTPSGCTATASVAVTQNITAPNSSITNTTGTTTLTCYVNPLVLTGTSTTAGASFQWSGPSNFSSSNAAISVTAPGTYTLVVTGTNGCTATRTRAITQLLVSPTATATVSGVISCSTPTVTLSGSSSGTPVTYSWAGPGGFTSTLQNPTVSVAGTYVLTVTTTAGGCTGSSSVEVSSEECAGTSATARAVTEGVMNKSNNTADTQKILSVDVYPQPVAGRATIALKPANTVKVTVELYSIFNKKMATIYDGEVNELNNNITFDTDGIESGIYIYSIRYGNKQQQGRLIISH